MKLLAFCLLLVASFFTISATHSIDGLKKRFKPPKNYVYVPSGNMTVNTIDLSIQGFFIADHEITNAEYTAFLDDLKASNRMEDYEIAKIKPTNWTTINEHLKPFEIVYHTHKAYEDYPVVNISKEGAKLYCEWMNKRFENSKYGEHFHINFRLPQEVEWVYAAQGGNKNAIYGWGSNELTNNKGQFYANFKKTQPAIGEVSLMAPVHSYYPNEYGIYNLSGNVAEYTATTGSIKGGAWKDGIEALDIFNKNNYEEQSSPYIGFRPVITVVRK